MSPRADFYKYEIEQYDEGAYRWWVRALNSDPYDGEQWLRTGMSGVAGTQEEAERLARAGVAESFRRLEAVMAE